MPSQIAQATNASIPSRNRRTCPNKQNVFPSNFTISASDTSPCSDNIVYYNFKATVNGVTIVAYKTNSNGSIEVIKEQKLINIP